MFAYCLNNPISYSDPDGRIGIESIIITMAINGAKEGLVSGIIGAICGFSTTGTIEGAVEGFFEGFANGFISGCFDNAYLDLALNILGAADVLIECLKSGASFESSLMACIVAFGSSYIPGETGDELVDLFSNMTFGLGFSMLSTGIEEGVQQIGRQNQEANTPPEIAPVSVPRRPSPPRSSGGCTPREFVAVAFMY